MNYISGVDTLAGKASLFFRENQEDWHVTMAVRTVAAGLDELVVVLEAEEPLVPPAFSLHFTVHPKDTAFVWNPTHNQKTVLPDWMSRNDCVTTDFAHNTPIFSMIGQCGISRLTVACSESFHTLRWDAGNSEVTCLSGIKVHFFESFFDRLTRYNVRFRLDVRELPFHESIPDAAGWISSQRGMPQPMTIPSVAREPFYSTWYSYHHSITADSVLREAVQAKKLGMNAILVDDGWDFRPNIGKVPSKTGIPYAYCGDWKADKKKFPDMAKHVAEVQKLDMRYVLWYALPFMGRCNCEWDEWKDKLLTTRFEDDVGILDPRFPEVREKLIKIFENAVRKWNLDGFKIDFVDSFILGEKDPMDPENPGGRDLLSVPEAVCRLLTDISKRISKIKPDLLIEFRQTYIGPRIRSFANMLRAGDCPFSYLTNRYRTIDLRLTSGETAVHSDMLQWDPACTAEMAALQLLNVLFSVPQISMRLSELPADHLKMLKFWLAFWRRHRDTLLSGRFVPTQPEHFYPLVSAHGKKETVVAVYAPNPMIDVTLDKGRKVYIVNASGADKLPIHFSAKPSALRTFACTGRKVAVNQTLPEAGFCICEVPPSGLLEVQG
ncbi:MAG: glycoside hydrolase family 36 protein [Kiritimatiellia bacterium]